MSTLVLLAAAGVLHLQISGSAAPVEIAAATLAALPQHVAEAFFHGGAQRCTGPRLDAVLASAGVASGVELRGEALRQVVRAEGADGYAVVFAVGDLDPLLGNATVVVARQCNGKDLVADEGPYRLLADGDRRGARSVRQLVRLSVHTVP